MATKKNINIGGVFNSITGDKKIIITDNTYDDKQGKFQDVINSEVKSKLADQDSRITSGIQSVQQSAAVSQSKAESAAASAEQSSQSASMAAGSALRTQEYAGDINKTLKEIAGSANIGDAALAQVLLNTGNIGDLSREVYIKEGEELLIDASSWEFGGISGGIHVQAPGYANLKEFIEVKQGDILTFLPSNDIARKQYVVYFYSSPDFSSYLNENSSWVVVTNTAVTYTIPRNCYINISASSSAVTLTEELYGELKLTLQSKQHATLTDASSWELGGISGGSKVMNPAYANLKEFVKVKEGDVITFLPSASLKYNCVIYYYSSPSFSEGSYMGANSGWVVVTTSEVSFVIPQDCYINISAMSPDNSNPLNEDLYGELKIQFPSKEVVISRIARLEAGVFREESGVIDASSWEFGGISAGNHVQVQGYANLKNFVKLKRGDVITFGLSPIIGNYNAVVYLYNEESYESYKGANSGWINVRGSSVTYTMPQDCYINISVSSIASSLVQLEPSVYGNLNVTLPIVRVISRIDDAEKAVKDVMSSVGNMAQLATSNKKDLVSAINEVASLSGGSGTTANGDDAELKNNLIQQTYSASSSGALVEYPEHLTLLHFSDIHGSTANLASILAWRTKYSSFIDDVIHTGDSVSNTISNPNPFEQVGGASSILNVIGNHEAWNGSDPDYNATSAETYAKIFANNIAFWNVVHDGNPSHCYYYKDFASKKFRLIVLDSVHWHTLGTNVQTDSAQKTWFESTLADAKIKGFAVVCAMHYPPFSGITFVKAGGFTHPTAATSGKVGDGWYASDEIFDCVDTFIDGGGIFACWIVGHTHTDSFGVVTNHNRQTICVIQSNSRGHYFDKMVANTKTQEAFNVITFDKALGLIKITRIGNDKDNRMQSKKTLCYDYVNKVLISNT